MATTNYGFEVPTGSALVNPLTIDAPNWQKLDTVLKGVQDDSVQEASELVSGKVHAITCLDSGAKFMHFTATGDFRTGDTFTFNGSPISAFLPDGSGLSDYAYRVNSEVLICVIGNRLTVYTYAVDNTAENALNLGGNPPEYYGRATDTIATYTQTYISGVHNFVGNGANGKVKIVNNFNLGDTVQINGNPVTAYADSKPLVESLVGVDLVGKTIYFAFDSASSVVTFAIGGGDKSNKVVWNNPSPGTSFAAQTVNVDLTPYTHILVEGKQATGNGFVSYALVPVGTSGPLSLVWQSGGKFSASERAVIARSTEVQFGNGEDVTASAVSVNNNSVVPTKIYGLII